MPMMAVLAGLMIKPAVISATVGVVEVRKMDGAQGKLITIHQATVSEPLNETGAACGARVARAEHGGQPPIRGRKQTCTRRMLMR